VTRQVNEEIWKVLVINQTRADTPWNKKISVNDTTYGRGVQEAGVQFVFNGVEQFELNPIFYDTEDRN
jgi:hypothetical protein